MQLGADCLVRTCFDADSLSEFTLGFGRLADSAHPGSFDETYDSIQAQNDPKNKDSPRQKKKRLRDAIRRFPDAPLLASLNSHQLARSGKHAAR